MRADLMQQKLIVGDTLKFSTSVPDYPASDGWTLKYRLIPRTSGTPREITASADGDDYEVSVSAATTSTWGAGEYSWSSWVELGVEKYTIDSGVITLLPDPRVATTLDGRTQAAKAVDDLRAALATYTASSGHIASYTINGRSMTFKSAADIIGLLSYWQAQLDRETAADALARGLGNPRHVYTRFDRV